MFNGEQYYYGQALIEPSPLNRVNLNSAAGTNWNGANRGVESGYFLNTVDDEVRIWNVNIGALGAMSSYISPGTYDPGQLFKSILTDENGKQVVEFKDKEGHVILKKVQNSSEPDNGSGRNHSGWLCTYYLYDKLGNLRCVIQPRGVELVESFGWVLNNGIVLNDQCFRYEYDSRKRMVIKKVPGAAAVYLVYDERDRMVMTQDGNLRTSVKWLVTAYDHLNRPVETGLWTDGISFATHLTTAAASSSYPNTSSNFEQLTVSHYDDYSNTPGGINSTFDGTW